MYSVSVLSLTEDDKTVDYKCFVQYGDEEWIESHQARISIIG